MCGIWKCNLLYLGSKFLGSVKSSLAAGAVPWDVYILSSDKLTLHWLLTRILHVIQRLNKVMWASSSSCSGNSFRSSKWDVPEVSFKYGNFYARATNCMKFRVDCYKTWSEECTTVSCTLLSYSIHERFEHNLLLPFIPVINYWVIKSLYCVSQTRVKGLYWN